MTLTVLKRSRLQQAPRLSNEDWGFVAAQSGLPAEARADVESVLEYSRWQTVPFPMTRDDIFLLEFWVAQLEVELRRIFEDRAKYGLPNGPSWDELAAEHYLADRPSSTHFAVTQLEGLADHLDALNRTSIERDDLRRNLIRQIGSISSQVRKLLTNPMLFFMVWDAEPARSEQRYWMAAACPNEPRDIVAAVLELQCANDRLALLSARLAYQRPMHLDLQVRLLDQIIQRFTGRPLKRLAFRRRKNDPSCRLQPQTVGRVEAQIYRPRAGRC